MNYRYIRLLVTALLIATMAAPVLVAQTSTTGAIEGKITDSSGAPLPGVTVELTSPNLQGTKTEVSDGKGLFRFSLLPTGNYSLTSTLAGFSPTRQNNIALQLGRTVTLDVRMSAAVTEQITVTAAAPVVDVTSTTSGANVSAHTMQSLPLARNFVAAAQLAPGTNNDDRGPTVYGSSGAENQYIIDGLNTTGVHYGLNGKQLNMEFVQEVEVKTGGMQAEYGRLTGGAINAITKSGGNQFSGDVFGVDAPKSLRGDTTTFGNRSVTLGSVTETGTKVFDAGADLGGYFLKDRIWFFGAYDHLDNTDTTTRINTPIALPNYSLPVGAALGTTTKSNLYAGKLTVRLSENQNLAASVFGDPRNASGPLFTISGPPSTFEGTTKQGGADYAGRYNGIFGTNFIASAEVGKHNEDLTYGGAGTQIPLLLDQTVSPNVRTGGFAYFDNEKFNRTVYKADVSSFFSTHEIKIGGDIEDMKGHIENYSGGGGQLIYKLLTADGQTYYRHRFYLDDTKTGFDRSSPATWTFAIPEITEPATKNTSAYLQDSWRVVPNLTVNAGVRWEKQAVFGRFGATAFTLDKNWAPRLGVIWDVENNGRSKLYANYGRFFEAIPMDINIRAFGGELVCFCYNNSPDPANWQPDVSASKPRTSTILGSSTEPADPNLKGQHIDEYIVGYQHELASNLSIEIKGTYRKLGNVIEDMLIGKTGSYLIANPGSGIGREAGFYEGGTVVTPQATRTYKGVEVALNKHFSNSTQFYANYVWSRLEGNYDGTNQTSTGQLDPNINSAFDYADFIVNNHGLLSSDRTHQVKFYGSWTASSGPVRGLTAGIATHYYSGTPLTANGYSFAYANWEYYLTPRGSLGRGPADYEADFHLDYPIRAGATSVKLIADVFNVLNLQRKTSLDTRYNRVQDAPCAGFVVPSGMTISDVCTGDGGLVAQAGTVNPISTVDISKAPNPGFLKAGTTFSGPRQFRIGVRVSF